MAKGSRDYYEILGVDKKASPDEIKRAYRKLARQYHPDVNKEAGSDEKFKEINEAYQTLSAPNKRSQYDYYGTAGGPGGAPGGFEGFDFGGQGFDFGGFGDLNDIVNNFFGGGRRTRQERGADLRYDLRISLEEAAKGIERELNITHFVSCQTCKGSGAKPGSKPKQCSTCKGSGQVRKSQRTILGSFTRVATCPACGGSGEIISSPCSDCRGDGRVKKSHKIKVKVPAGIDSGYRLRVAGSGDAGRKGAPPGDLYIFVQVEPHHLFNRDGADIFYRTTISFVQAILGDEIEVPTLDGKATLKIPRGTQPNTRFRIKEQGMPHLQHKEKGNLYVLVEIEIPSKLNKAQEELLKKYKNA